MSEMSLTWSISPPVIRKGIVPAESRKSAQFATRMYACMAGDICHAMIESRSHCSCMQAGSGCDWVVDGF